MTSNHTTEPSEEDRHHAIASIICNHFDRDECEPSYSDLVARCNAAATDILSRAISPSPDDRMGDWIKDAKEALTELRAMVWGECPSLLNEDSGGNAELDGAIEELIASAPATTRLAASREGGEILDREATAERIAMHLARDEETGRVYGLTYKPAKAAALLALEAALASPAPMPEGELVQLRKALVDHNDALRSAAQVASRDGADTNWLTFRGHVHWTLAEHHETTNEARAALGSVQDKEGENG